MWWKIGTYNLQASLLRILLVLSTSKCAILGLQSTGRYSSPSYFDRPQRIGQYSVLHFPWKATQYVNKSCGCALAWRSDFLSEKSISNYWLPPEELQGREGAIRFKKRGVYDITPIVVYFPAGSSADERQAYTKLLSWLTWLVTQLPARTLPLLLVDAHARMQASTSVPLAVGSSYHRQENRSGGQFRHWLEEQKFSALNTFISPQPTWHGLTTNSQIDFIALPIHQRVHLGGLFVSESLGYLWQLANTIRRLDHSPVFAWIWHRSWHEDPISVPYSNWSPDVQAALETNKDLAQSCSLRIEDFFEVDDVQEQIEDAFHSKDSNQFWSILNTALYQTQRQFTKICRSKVARWLPLPQPEIWDKYATAKRQIYTLLLRVRSVPSIRKIFFRWQPLAQLRNIHEQTAKLIDRAFRARERFLVGLLNKSLSNNDITLVWKIMRATANSSLGPKKRIFRTIPKQSPQLREWKQFLQLPGSQGGFSVHPFRTSTLEEFALLWNHPRQLWQPLTPYIAKIEAQLQKNHKFRNRTFTSLCGTTSLVCGKF